MIEFPLSLEELHTIHADGRAANVLGDTPTLAVLAAVSILREHLTERNASSTSSTS